MWSGIIEARDEDESVALRALEELARAYWQPLYIFLRQRGVDEGEAADVVQGFFEHLLSREILQHATPRETRFRTFLLKCFTNWHSNQRREQGALRRGGGLAFIPVEELRLLREEPVVTDESPEQRFDRRWARAIYERALARLDAELAEREPERRALLAELRRRMLGPEAMTSDWEPVAERFGLSVGAVRKAAHDLRQRFAALLRQEVRLVVSRDEEVDEELRYLIRLLTHRT